MTTWDSGLFPLGKGECLPCAEGRVDQIFGDQKGGMQPQLLLLGYIHVFFFFLSTELAYSSQPPVKLGMDKYLHFGQLNISPEDVVSLLSLAHEKPPTCDSYSIFSSTSQKV